MPETVVDGTAANMARVGQAGEALVRWLGGDPRVRESYAAWRLGLPPDPAAYGPAHKARDLAALDRLVRHELGLDYGWLAPLLLFDFADNLRMELTGAAEGGVLLIPEDVGLRAGRRAKGKGQHIARDVGWFYRAKIKTPRDTVYAIAQEYARAERRRTPAHSVVQNGIARARRLLAVLDLDDPAI